MVTWDLNIHDTTLQVWWCFHHKESTSSSYFTPLFASVFLLYSSLLILSLQPRTFPPYDDFSCWMCEPTHPPPIPECWPASSHSMSTPSSLPPPFLSILPSLRHLSLPLPPSLLFLLPVCLSIPFSVSLSSSHRQQRQWSGAVDRASPAGGAGPAAGSDQVHQEGASVSVSRLQECTSSSCRCRHHPNCFAIITIL